jgi:hypothetical protein
MFESIASYDCPLPWKLTSLLRGCVEGVSTFVDTSGAAGLSRALQEEGA